MFVNSISKSLHLGKDAWGRVVIALIILLVGLGAFGLGRLSALVERPHGVRIYAPASGTQPGAVDNATGASSRVGEALPRVTAVPTPFTCRPHLQAWERITSLLQRMARSIMHLRVRVRRASKLKIKCGLRAQLMLRMRATHLLPSALLHSNHSPMLIVDVEASGVNYEKNSIVSLGAIDFVPDQGARRELYLECRVWDGAHINDEAMAVNGFTHKEVTDLAKMSEADLTHAFLAWALEAEDRTLAGQNVSFDRDFLKAAALRAGHIHWPFAHRTLDTHTLCFMHMVNRGLTPPVDPIKKHSALNLDAVLVYCGIPEEPTPHNALTGAKSHAEVISRLLYGKPLLPEFEKFPIPW